MFLYGHWSKEKHKNNKSSYTYLYTADCPMFPRKEHPYTFRKWLKRSDNKINFRISGTSPKQNPVTWLAKSRKILHHALQPRGGFQLCLLAVGPLGIHKLRHHATCLLKTSRIGGEIEEKHVDVSREGREARLIRHISTSWSLLQRRMVQNRIERGNVVHLWFEHGFLSFKASGCSRTIMSWCLFGRSNVCLLLFQTLPSTKGPADCTPPEICTSNQDQNPHQLLYYALQHRESTYCKKKHV